MPSPRKFSDEIYREIVEAYHSDDSGQVVAARYGCDYSHTVRKIWLTEYGDDCIRSRFRRMCSVSKTGNLNPMKGNFKEKHPRYKAVHTHSAGYRIIEAPRWYTGPTDKNGKVLEHIIVACREARLRQLPDLHVVHHKDEDKLNNDPSNLQIVSRASHMLVHRWLRHKKKVQRLSRKGVQFKGTGSAPHPDKDDDIV